MDNLQHSVDFSYVCTVINSCTIYSHLESCENWILDLKVFSTTEKTALLRKLADRETELIKRK